MVKAKLRTEALAKLVGVSRVTVSTWRNGHALPDDHRFAELERVLAEHGASLPAAFPDQPAASAVREPTSPYVAWPKGWQVRAHRLSTEAAKAGATEEEIALVRGWMLDPQLNALWFGGPPADDRMSELDGIELGARAWLRARGRKVKPK